jgi:hypothetical protein
MSGAIPPLPQYAFLVWCSVKAERQLYLYLLPFLYPDSETIFFRDFSCWICVQSKNFYSLQFETFTDSVSFEFLGSNLKIFILPSMFALVGL